jgi:hypothetical protein
MKIARNLFLIFAFAMAGHFASAQTNAAPADLAPATPTTQNGPVVMPPPASAPPNGDATFQLPANGAAAPGGPVVEPPAKGSSIQPPLPGPGAQGGPAQGSVPPGPAVAGPPKGDEIYDIRPPYFYLRSWFWFWVTLAVLVTLALLVLLWRWFASRAGVNPKTAYDLALEKLERARELMNEDDPAPYGVAVSEAIRTYLQQRFHAASTHRTTEEFLRQMQEDAATPLAAHRDLLGAFLQSCDLLKFAQYRPGLAELEEVQQRAVNFVTATKPAPVSEANQPALVPRTT